MLRFDAFRRCVPSIAWAAATCFLLAPIGAAATTLQIVQGSGEFRTLKTDITVSDPVAIDFQWTTDEASAAGGRWKVKKVDGSTATVVLQGYSTPAPKPGHFMTFTIPGTGPDSFLAASPPSNAVKYTVTIEARDASNHKLGSPSAEVTVTQQKAKPQPPVHFSGRAPVFPRIELVHYDESVGTVGDTQIWSVTATVTLRGENFGKTKTDSVGVAINDWNNLWKMIGNGARIDPLEPGKASKNVTIKLTAQLPPPKSQLGQEQQVREWQQAYKDRCGVDLRAYLTASAKDELIDNEQEQYLYLGYGKSKPWEEGHAVSNAEVCDAKQCVHLNDVARSIYKQLACRVVGYAYYVGNSLKPPYAIFDSYGLARTRDNPPALDFGPGSKMQIASASKILTALTAIKVIGDDNLDSFAYEKFPSNWHVPENSIVRKIKDREFISQTSGVRQYYAGNQEDDANLKAFFTQSIPNPNASSKCYSSTAKIPVKYPIQNDKSWCYSNANFSIMRVVIPRADGETSNDATTLADKYVSLARQRVFDPVGDTDVACKPPSSLDHYALAYKYPGINGGDWGDLTTVCGAWGWYVSVEDYARILLSLNSADHKILSDCQFLDMQTNPASGIGWDTTTDGSTRRLEKNGGDGMGNGATVGTSVTIYGGSAGTRSHGSCTSGKPGVVGVLFINSDGGDAAGTLLQALHDGSKPKP